MTTRCYREGVRALVATFALVACKEPPRHEPPAVTRRSDAAVDPTRTEPTRAEPTGMAAQQETCAVKDVELIYVVDWDNNLSSFDPRKLPGDPFTKIGKLTCEGVDKPYTMAIDRHGIAWVAYGNRNLYRVRITDARCAAGVGVTGNPDIHGMGFAKDATSEDAETLYVANREDESLGIADIAARPPAYAEVSKLDFHAQTNPELTGTADGKLYAFFPHERFISEIDRSTGKLLGPRRNVPGHGDNVGGYAFAHWGGVFYVFSTLDGNTRVQAINRKTGKAELVLEHLPMEITGAGVSTCAPLLERAP